MSYSPKLLLGQAIEVELENQFYTLATEWENAVSGLSLTTQMAEYPAYQKIIAMGIPVVPLLLLQLHEHPVYWFSALNAITGVNPIKLEHRGRVKKMAEDWLEWGRGHSNPCSSTISEWKMDE
jgi:hypothetical protein